MEATGRFIKALAKLTGGQGTRQEQPPEGVSLHLLRLVPASSWARKGCQGQPSSWPPRGEMPRQTDGDTRGRRRLEGEPSPPPGREAAGRPGRSPGPAAHLLQPGPQFLHLRGEGSAVVLPTCCSAVWEAGVAFVRGNADQPGPNTYYVSGTVISALFTVPERSRTTTHQVGP